MNIEKKPSRPRSIEFRLDMSDEEGKGPEDTGGKAKKRVTYKATDRGQSFFPDMEGERQQAPPRDLPPFSPEGYQSE